MIIILIMRVFHSLLDTLLVLDLPSIPTQVYDNIDYILSYVSAGGGILANYCDLGYLLSLFAVIVSIDIGIGLYHFIMWVIKKIPLSIE